MGRDKIIQHGIVLVEVAALGPAIDMLKSPHQNLTFTNYEAPSKSSPFLAS